MFSPCYCTTIYNKCNDLDFLLYTGEQKKGYKVICFLVYKTE